VETGIKGAIDFLQSQLHVESLHNLPYPALLIPLSVFFAEEPGTQGRYSNEQLAAAKRWFWRACFSRRYSGQSVRAARVDVGEMVRLKQGLDHRLGEFNHEIDEWFFTGSQFRMASANTKTFILLLAQQRPVSFLSGNAVDLRMVLLSYNRTEFHHMFPRSYLRDRGIGDNQANALANFCFMSRTDNNRISSKAPSVYRGMMPQDESLVDRTLQQALVPRSLFTNNYKLFLSDRALMLVARARELMNAGLDGSLPSTDDRQLPREWSP
jgi:hypothetical protein